jgi:hypothetical protein
MAIRSDFASLVGVAADTMHTFLWGKVGKE